MAKDNQHFIPKGYLRGFTIAEEKSLIWEYDKNDGSISRHPKSISQICSKYQYYAQKNEDGSNDKESIENAFHNIEDKAPRAIKKISPRLNAEKLDLTQDDKAVTAVPLTFIIMSSDLSMAQYYEQGHLEAKPSDPVFQTD